MHIQAFCYNPYPLNKQTAPSPSSARNPQFGMAINYAFEQTLPGVEAALTRTTRGQWALVLRNVDDPRRPGRNVHAVLTGASAERAALMRFLDPKISDQAVFSHVLAKETVKGPTAEELQQFEARRRLEKELERLGKQRRLEEEEPHQLLISA